LDSSNSSSDLERAWLPYSELCWQKEIGDGETEALTNSYDIHGEADSTIGCSTSIFLSVASL
jgi:hypothetical protein